MPQPSSPDALTRRQALRLYADCAYCYTEAARLDLLQAEMYAKQGRPAARLYDKAVADAERALANDPKIAEARVVAAEASLRVSGPA